MQGCYIGQETLAKLTNLNGVKQQLWGLDLEQPVEVGTSLLDQVNTPTYDMGVCVLIHLYLFLSPPPKLLTEQAYVFEWLSGPNPQIETVLRLRYLLALGRTC